MSAKFFLVRSNVEWQLASDADSLITFAKWRMPDVACPECGGTTRPTNMPGYCYPAADFSKSKALARQLTVGMGPLDPPSWRSLRAKIIEALPYPVEITPGTEFGPCEDTITGHPADCYPLRHFFLAEAAFTKLERAGVAGLFALPAKLRVESKPKLRYVEIQIEHAASLAGPLDLKRVLKTYDRLNTKPEGKWKLECKHCGRKSGDVPRRPVLVGQSIPRDVPLFRLRDKPSAILCSEAFATAVTSLKLTNVRFEAARLDGSEKHSGFAEVRPSDPAAWVAGRD
jgi:hypothetical protein